MRCPRREPAKWASKLRTLQAEGSGAVVAKFDLDSGHFSRWIREKSYDQAFVLDKLGLAEAKSKATSG